MLEAQNRKTIAMGKVVETPPKGYKLEGKPRQRAYRTYFGLTAANQVIRYPDYEAREIDVREGRVKRITKEEANAIESRGLTPSPLVVSTQWSPREAAPKSAPPAPHGQMTDADTKHAAMPAPMPRYANRNLIEARALVATVRRTLDEVEARLKALEQEEGL